MIAIIGEKGTEVCDANVRVLQSLTQEDIQISTINQGAGKLNLLIGVPDEKYEEAIRAIYRTIDESIHETV
jgi:aspartate kinase